MTANLQASVTLAYPIAVSKEGKAETVSVLVVKRPRTKQIKALVALLGPSLVKLLMSDLPSGPVSKEALSKLDLSALDGELIAGLLSQSNLDALTTMLAELAGITAAEADELDPVDLLALGMAIAGFFPGLAALIASSNSPQT